ncbi:MAG: hypothetical protein OEY72_00045 [Gammaproteobacteria bacterium]|nr:hypothetical protein [Gammaproteobacteria bacterium]
MQPAQKDGDSDKRKKDKPSTESTDEGGTEDAVEIERDDDPSAIDEYV